MADVEFRLRRSEDELEPYYVRIAEAGDGAPLAFTENHPTPEHGDMAIATLRSGIITVDTLFDRNNDVWFFRFKDGDGHLLFRSMPCRTEDEMHATIERIREQAPGAEIFDDRD
jgi:hypothetical protein